MLKSKKAPSAPAPKSLPTKAKPEVRTPVVRTKAGTGVKPSAAAAGKARKTLQAVPPAAAPAKLAAPAIPEAGGKARGPKPGSSASAASAAKGASITKSGGGGGRPASAKPATGASAKAVTAPEVAAAAAVKKPARKSIKEAAGVSTDAVARRTGKTWDDWFEVLDSAGAATLDQRGIIAILAQKHGIGPWWQQMIAVGYESLRAKTDKPAAADGFQILESCTLSAPAARVFKLWNDATERGRWLADERFVVKSATPGKVLRARWGKGNSQVTVSFVEKAGKTDVAVEHQHIESRIAADQMKAYWQKKLALLDEALTTRT
jgi:uncharacterized protein YndB with AHSA1/START domain